MVDGIYKGPDGCLWLSSHADGTVCEQSVTTHDCARTHNYEPLLAEFAGVLGPDPQHQLGVWVKDVGPTMLEFVGRFSRGRDAIALLREAYAAAGDSDGTEFGVFSLAAVIARYIHATTSWDYNIEPDVDLVRDALLWEAS